MRKFGLMVLGTLVLLGLAGCGGIGGAGNPPLTQLIQADSGLYNDGQTLLDEGVAAFQDLMPQGFTPQATGEPRPLTMTKDGTGNIVLIGGPWRPPFPWPLPPVDKPLFLVIKQPSCPGGCKPRARLAFLRRERDGSYTLEWHGTRGTAPIRVPAQVEQVGDPGGSTARKIDLSVRKTREGWEIDIIIVIGANPNRAIHIVSSLPPDDQLPGRELGGVLSTAGYEQAFREICCGYPKPWPPLWPPLILQRGDLSVVAVPYDNPNLRGIATPEEIVGQDLGFIYLRRKNPLGGPTTDCGPNGVWCPPEDDPFLNVRLIRLRGGEYAVELRRLGGENGRVVATLPAQVVLEPDEGGYLGITDNVNDPESPLLQLRWPKIKIIIIIE